MAKVFGWLAKYYDSNDESIMKVTRQVSFACEEDEVEGYVLKASKESDKWVKVYKCWTSHSINE